MGLMASNTIYMDKVQKSQQANTKPQHLTLCIPNSPLDARPLVARLLASQSTVCFNKSKAPRFLEECGFDVQIDQGTRPVNVP